MFVLSIILILSSLLPIFISPTASASSIYPLSDCADHDIAQDNTWTVQDMLADAYSYNETLMSDPDTAWVILHDEYHNTNTDEYLFFATGYGSQGYPPIFFSSSSTNNGYPEVHIKSYGTTPETGSLMVGYQTGIVSYNPSAPWYNNPYKILSIRDSAPSGCLLAYGGNVTFSTSIIDGNYYPWSTGSWTAPDPVEYSDVESIYTMFNVFIDEDGTVTLIYSPSFEDIYNLDPPDQVILALEDSEENLITADGLYYGYASYNELEDGEYIAHGYAYYEDDVGYEILESVFRINVNGSAFSIIYNETEGSYCSVANGYEWNCSIPQGDDEITLIDGTPESWTAEECSVTALGGCVRNVIHFIGEYLGINSPPTSNISKSFLGFEPTTYGLSSILTAPLSLIQSLSSAKCSAVDLPLPFVDEDLTLPCMSTIYSSMFGTTFLTLYQTITTGVIAYWIVVDLFATVKAFKDPDEDRIEVAKL
jgi:hypothetical protein